MNPGRTWMLGLLNDAKHPALAAFPSEANCDWQWVDLLPRTTAMNITSLTHTIQPIVQPIDDWNRNLRLAMLFECSVGSGKLMVTSLETSPTPPWTAANTPAHPRFATACSATWPRRGSPQQSTSPPPT